MVRLVEKPESTEATDAGLGWEPHVVAMVCNWCTYAGADMAGTTRRIYSPNARIVRFLCTGRLDPLFIVKAFEQGADGVIISGCHPGDCHYVQGNVLARRRLTVFRSLMEFLGLDERRLQFAWVSASEGVKWSRVVNEVVESIREAGPLGEWARPIDTPEKIDLQLDFEEPDRGISPEDAEKITGHLREVAKRLLTDGDVSEVIGYTYGSLPDQTAPAFVSNPQEVDSLVWNEHCANNLTVYIPEAVKSADEKIGVVVKSCDAKAVTGLIRENQITRDDVVLLSVSCSGMRESGQFAAKCFGCPEAVSPIADWSITPDGVHEGSISNEERAVAPDPRQAEIAALESAPALERWNYWQGQFAQCIRCYACRAVCPLCYCSTCIADKHRPQWVPTAFNGPGNTAWNVARAMHLAGRCIGCDECTRVCPADIRLDLLNIRLANEIESRYGYVADTDPNSPPPLTVFEPGDTGDFL